MVGWCFTAMPIFAVLKFDNSFYSPRNAERPLRKSTTLIILHTTEAPSRSAIRKLSERGECHYGIDEQGRVYRIIDHRREAYHAGRSMWNGRTNVDSFSVGIEVCGYHDKPLKEAQIQALIQLIGEVKYIYKISDDRVLSHSHVAYGAPNKWHKRSHRGRKRCGMMFALPSLRARLNLKSRPMVDPDVAARRLVVGDAYLAQVLYGAKAQARFVATATKEAPASNVIAKNRSAWDIARDAYNDTTTRYIFPDGTQKRGHQIANFKMLPSGTKVLVETIADNRAESFQIVGVDGKVDEIVGDEMLLGSTFYVYPDGRYQRGTQLDAAAVLKVPYGTKVLLGYAVGGPVTAKYPPVAICGSRWRSEDTFFLISGVLVPGNKVAESRIPIGTMVFVKS